MPIAGPSHPPRRRGIRLLGSAVALGALASLTVWAAAPIDLPRARSAQEHLVMREPGNAAAQVDLANLLRLEGQLDAAEAGYRRALEIDPRSVAAHFNLGLLLQERDRPNDAQREFRRALDLDPRQAWAWYQIGVIEASRGRDSSAVHAYARALALDPRLRFPDVNPHVIDNRLISRAMLVAYRDYMDPAQPLPTYEDPGRIAGLLAEKPAPEAPAHGESPGQGTAATAPAPGVGTGGVTGRGAVTTGGAPIAEPGTPRELSSRDIAAGSRTGQVVGGGSGGGASRAYDDASVTRYRPAPEPIDDDDEAEPTIAVPASEPAFQPGVVSTGRLELRLWPAAARAEAPASAS